MKLGTMFHDETHGRCMVIGDTPMSYAFRDSSGKRHLRRKAHAKRWRAGALCRVIPDAERPDDICGGVVLDLGRDGKPGRIRLTEHPVWNGAIVCRQDVFRVLPVEVA